MSEWNKLSCDVLVGGGGIGGLACATAIKEHNPNADVLVVEKNFAGFAGKANRGGGVLQIRVWNSLPDGGVDRTGVVRVLTDGIESRVPAGSDVEITRGNSMTIYPGLYHLFTPKTGCGDLVVGEVSSINDDRTDNVFADGCPRFIPVEEDCPLTVPLCNEYDALFC